MLSHTRQSTSQQRKTRRGAGLILSRMTAARSSRRRRTAALKAALDAMPGVAAEPVTPSRSAVPLALMYKVMGKVFAILAVGDDAFVIVKSEPDQAELLRERYAGVGHRSHLDRRFWIAVDLDSDVPAKEIRRLVGQSYQLVCTKLTKKQKAELAARSS
jgi:predicted DNA-binding protein (MmcQ/YjbR family)